MTVSPREQLPTLRGRQTQAAIDAAARAVIARKGILATTISDNAAEAGKSTASFYNYYDSKEAMVREWAVRVPVRSLTYPRTPAVLERVRQAIVSDVNAAGRAPS